MHVRMFAGSLKVSPCPAAWLYLRLSAWCRRQESNLHFPGVASGILTSMETSAYKCAGPESNRPACRHILIRVYSELDRPSWPRMLPDLGLLDDFLKLRHKENLGLKAWQKFVFQACIAVLAGVYCYRARLTGLYLPLFGRIWSVGAWIIPFSAFAFIATVNAVNLTDGLDGLASAVSIPFFAFSGIIILLENGSVGLSTICFCLVGSLLAYLVFNSSSASVFMGDTGSLALGGFASSICVFSGNMLYIPIIGLMFVISVISVLIQVIYYKVTGGKRVFLMAPLHHHFQEKGYSESKIAYGYFIITLVLGVLTILSLL